ncbi:hypothetical protein RQP53_03505 [Paucibacter sp. APW11]|uniref:Uncharacterized protein n=1 Tax=Roseateles aquae TaxID=3077235 RepID=A0ABU3P6Z9_9BURK|nr:hypothetical protein [Paucibacter sp. APW11]MDT8998339.1 hypothetical protein [Paucibacter sp. APW11]
MLDNIPVLQQDFTATGTGRAIAPLARLNWTHQVVLKTTAAAPAAVSATLVAEGTNDPTGATGWTAIATFPMTGTDTGSGVSDNTPPLQHTWARLRWRCTALGANTAASAYSSGV